MPPRYATAEQARADAAALDLLAHVGAIPALLLASVERVALNPAAGSDALLILADALREAADPLAFNTAAARAMHRLADALAALAPTRANLIPEPTP